MQIASGLEQAQMPSAWFGLVEAIGVKSCLLHVPARPDFVEPSVCHFQYLKIQYHKNDVSSKIAFVQVDDEKSSSKSVLVEWLTNV